jgi:hypothetical protein
VVAELSAVSLIIPCSTEEVGMGQPQPKQVKNLNEDKPWSEMDVFDLENHLAQGDSVARTADFLMRREEEVRAKMEELGLE